MTKAEKAHLEALEIRLALRLTDPEGPDVPPPGVGDPHGTRTAGWLASPYTGEVRRAWSLATRHGREGSDSGSQGPVALFSSRARALRWARGQLELEAAKKLRRLDLEIADTPEDRP